MSTEPTPEEIRSATIDAYGSPDRRGTRRTPRASDVYAAYQAEVRELGNQLTELRAAAGVPDGATHDEALRFLAHSNGRLDRVGALAVLWAARGTPGFILTPDYQRGRADAYIEAVTGLRAALGWPAKP